MKKILFMMSLCALAFASCQKAEIEEVAASAGQNTYTFVVNNVSETKATIGDKNGTQWPVLWAAGDQIGVYGGGQLLGVATLDEGSAGSNCGNFILTTNATISAGDELYLSYPYTEGSEMKKGQVAEKHTLTEAGIGANGVAYAYAEYAGENTEFTLTHLNAYLKFNLSSSEFAGYSLQGITLWAKGAKLSGGVEVGNGDVVTYTGVGDYVKTTLAAPTEMSTTAQPVYVSTLPENLTGKEVYAIVHMTKGIETVTLPVKLNGAGNIPAGSVTEVTLPALKKSLAPKWYEPVETRYIAAYGDGWCYGPANTVRFTENGQEKTVELKARGNFMKVQEPVKVKLAFMGQYNAFKTTNEKLFINDQETHEGNYVYKEIDITDKVNYTVKVKMSKFESSGGHMAGMKVFGADGSVIWGTNLWLTVNSWGDVQYDNGTIMECNLGADTKAAAAKSWTAFGAYFQWGRPWAFTKNNRGEGHTGTALNAETEKIDLAKSAANPYYLLYFVPTTQGGEGLYDWYYGDGTNTVENDLNDLWGNPSTSVNSTTSGVKSIYDPCPAGYRVISPAILKEVEDGIDVEYTYVSDTEATVVSKGTTEVNVSAPTKLFWLSHKGASWGFHGGLWNSGSSTWKHEKISFAAFWSNANVPTPSYGRAMFYQLKSTDQKIENTKWLSEPVRSTGRSKTETYPVRCMVDTENR